MTRKYVWHNGTFVDVTDWKPPPRRTPYIIRDHMDAAVHPATGKMHDSKSAFRAETRALGLTEVGTDTGSLRTKRTEVFSDRGALKKDIARAWEQVEQGMPVAPAETLDSWGDETRMLATE